MEQKRFTVKSKQFTMSKSSLLPRIGVACWVDLRRLKDHSHVLQNEHHESENDEVEAEMKKWM